MDITEKTFEFAKNKSDPALKDKYTKMANFLKEIDSQQPIFDEINRINKEIAISTKEACKNNKEVAAFWGISI